MCVVCMKGPWSERGVDDCDAVAAGGARCVPRCVQGFMRIKKGKKGAASNQEFVFRIRIGRKLVFYASKSISDRRLHLQKVGVHPPSSSPSHSHPPPTPPPPPTCTAPYTRGRHREDGEEECGLNGGA